MENPNEWPDVVKCISDNLKYYYKAQEVGVVGYSLPYFIYLVLKENGYLKDGREEEIQIKCK